ncbi:predicted protein [Postia placenta Mad-698-R]|nr:predicted protein [Postia placenta Mad-698-R]
MIIDFVWPDRPTLVACALTCRAWTPKSRRNLFYSLDFHSTKQLTRLSRLLKTRPNLVNLVKQLSVAPDAAHLNLASAFPFPLARKLTRVEHLRVLGISRNFPCLDPSFTAALHEFKSITRLEITRTIFPSLVVFGRLLFALPNLSVLICASVRWTKAEYKASMIPPMAAPLKLICMSMSFAYWSTDLVDWLLAVVSHESLSIINLRRIWMKDMKIIEKILSTVGPSLRHLVIGCDILKADEEIHYPSLERNTRLRVIHLEFRAKGEWIPEMLSRVPFADLCQVNIMCAGKIASTDLDRIDCTRIDGLLSHKKFAKLEAVVFQYHNYVATGWIAWWQVEIPRRFPRLWSKGLIRFEPCKSRPALFNPC